MSKSHPSNLLNSQDEEEEEETDGLVNQVLDEIGIEMQMVSEAPPGMPSSFRAIHGYLLMVWYMRREHLLPRARQHPNRRNKRHRGLRQLEQAVVAVAEELTMIFKHGWTSYANRKCCVIHIILLSPSPYLRRYDGDICLSYQFNSSDASKCILFFLNMPK